MTGTMTGTDFPRPFTGPAPEADAAAAARLPGGLLRDAARRLGLMSAISVLTGGAFFLLSELMGVSVPGGAPFRFSVFPCFLTMSLVVFVLSRSPRLRPETVLDIGLVYKILAAACLAVLVDRQPWPTAVTLPSWSPIAVWVLIFSLVVPDSPRRTLWSSAAAAATDPAAVLVLAWSGQIALPGLAQMLHRFLPNLVAVLVGWSVARIVQRLGRQLVRARQLGSYQLREPIGRGGMGEVWAGEHRLLARRAAIKLIRPEVLTARGIEDGTALLERFAREARATAALRSPHTVQVYDSGLAPDGTFYYVMELLEGLDLRRLVERFGPQPAGRVVSLLRQACHSLHEAHAAGLVHRDVKPANLFVCRYGLDVDFLKVLDFGLVLQRPGAEVPVPGATRPAAPSGTPAFMAPEMILGAGPVDGRADLYSLGCVAYWLLTGRNVFASDSLSGILRQHLQETPTPPSVRAELPVPAELDRLLLACLAKDPADRPATARELEHRLAQLEDPAGWSDEDARSWWETHLPGASGEASVGGT